MAKKLTPNKLLTDFLLEIGKEKTSMAVIDGETTLVTRAEAVARGLYDMAEGGLREKVNPKTREIIRVYVKPDVAAFRLIREFTEGKASSDVVKEITNKKKAGEYGSGTRKRLGEILNKPKKLETTTARPTTLENQAFNNGGRD